MQSVTVFKNIITCFRDSLLISCCIKQYHASSLKDFLVLLIHKTVYFTCFVVNPHNLYIIGHIVIYCVYHAEKLHLSSL